MRTPLTKKDRDIISVMGERLSLREQCQCVVFPRLLEAMAMDYASGCCDAAISMRLDGCKRLVRSIRDLRRSFDAQKPGDNATFDVDAQNVEWCEEALRPYFSRLYTMLGAEIRAKHPDLSDGSAALVASACSCEVVLEALRHLWIYIARLLQDKCGLYPKQGYEDGRKFIGPQVRATGALVREFAGDCAIDIPHLGEWARELCNKLLMAEDYKPYNA